MSGESECEECGSGVSECEDCEIVVSECEECGIGGKRRRIIKHVIHVLCG